MNQSCHSTKILLTSYQWVFLFAGLTLVLLFFPMPFFYNDASSNQPHWGWFSFHFFHAHFHHWVSNVGALLILTWMHHHFYRPSQFILWACMFTLTGPLLGLIGVHGLHLGASALVYGLFHFLLATALWRRNRADLAVLFILLLLFPGMLWAPFAPPGVSWEGHTAGAIVGWLVAYFTRHLHPSPTHPTETEENSDPPLPTPPHTKKALSLFAEPKSQNLDHSVRPTNSNEQKPPT